jgi:hypothetical protein
MAERGLSVDDVKIRRWVQRYAPILNQRIRRTQKPESVLASRRNLLERCRQLGEVLGNSIYERSATAPPGFRSSTPSMRGAEASGDSQRPDIGRGKVHSNRLRRQDPRGHFGEAAPPMNL